MKGVLNKKGANLLVGLIVVIIVLLIVIIGVIIGMYMKIAEGKSGTQQNQPTQTQLTTSQQNEVSDCENDEACFLETITKKKEARVMLQDPDYVIEIKIDKIQHDILYVTATTIKQDPQNPEIKIIKCNFPYSYLSSRPESIESEIREVLASGQKTQFCNIQQTI